MVDFVLNIHSELGTKRDVHCLMSSRILGVYVIQASLTPNFKLPTQLLRILEFNLVDLNFELSTFLED